MVCLVSEQEKVSSVTDSEGYKRHPIYFVLYEYHGNKNGKILHEALKSDKGNILYLTMWETQHKDDPSLQRIIKELEKKGNLIDSDLPWDPITSGGIAVLGSFSYESLPLVKADARDFLLKKLSYFPDTNTCSFKDFNYSMHIMSHPTRDYLSLLLELLNRAYEAQGIKLVNLGEFIDSIITFLCKEETLQKTFVERFTTWSGGFKKE